VWDTDIRSDVTPWALSGQIHYAIRINGQAYEGVKFSHYRVPLWTY
jgi:hypothetical protein